VFRVEEPEHLGVGRAGGAVGVAGALRVPAVGRPRLHGLNHRGTETQRRQNQSQQEPVTHESPFLFHLFLLVFSSLCLCASVVRSSYSALGVWSSMVLRSGALATTMSLARTTPEL